ncbi:Ribonuclease HII [Diplonema papillatum]|nr:Ribonuclease HII [Diplonema papillatum]
MKMGKMKRKAGDDIGRERELEVAAKRQRALTVVGVDEAGRGPLAGPVVVAACALPKGFDGAGIDDSKKITRASIREALFERLTTAAGVRFAVIVVSLRHADGRNIWGLFAESYTPFYPPSCHVFYLTVLRLQT